MLNQLTLWDTPSVISLPALEDGESHAVLPGGPTTAKSGPSPARANRSRSPAKEPELLMNGTYGPTFSGSPVPSGPLESWENRLRQRLARIGSTECALTWKASPTPAGVLLSRLVPSTPRTVEIDSSSLVPTDYWRTPQATVIEPRSTVVKFSGRSPQDPQVGLPDQVMATMGLWATATATATARDWKSESASAEFDALRAAHPRGKTLPTQVLWTAALYPTPSASGFEATSPEMLLARRERCKETTSAGNGFGLTLGQFACLESAMRPTPMAGTPAQNGNSEAGNNDSSRKMVDLAHGTALDGSSATTGKRGVLNPGFPCWLMGYQLAHLSCGATAMQSFRKLPRKSSQL
ncbi:hypothetical protein J2W30_002812 [Variovorax boronicumulans]|nr:hypothetical protein [Variovorax boronicumulans]